MVLALFTILFFSVVSDPLLPLPHTSPMRSKKRRRKPVLGTIGRRGSAALVLTLALGVKGGCADGDQTQGHVSCLSPIWSRGMWVLLLLPLAFDPALSPTGDPTTVPTVQPMLQLGECSGGVKVVIAKSPLVGKGCRCPRDGTPTGGAERGKQGWLMGEIRTAC